MRFWVPLTTLVLLTFASESPMAHAQQAPPAETPWWPEGITEPARFRDGWNLRVPLLLQNPEASPIAAGTPVQIHLDVGLSMLEAGWPSITSASGRVPRSFTLDPDSVRLVEYGPSWSTVQSEVPIQVHYGWLEPDQTARYGKVQNAAFDAQRNPLITLEWFLPKELATGGRAHYYAYFEILQNSDKPAHIVDEHSQENLDALYWIGSGRSVYGYHPGSSNQVPTIQVIATQSDTQVEVFTYRGSSSPRPDDRPGQENPFQIANSGGSQRYSLGVSPTHFRIDATRPIIVVAHDASQQGSGEFVPGLHGRFRDDDFLVPALARRMYVMAPFDSPEQVHYCVGRAPACADQPSSLAPGQYASFDVAPGPPNVVAPNTLFRVRAHNGQLLVQYVPDVGSNLLTQVPSIQGAPQGSIFQTATLINDKGRYVATAVGQMAHLDISRIPQPMRFRIQPPGDPIEIAGKLFPRSPEAANAPAIQGRFETEPLRLDAARDASVPAHERGPLVLRTGEMGHPGVYQITPFGGPHGQHFEIVGPFVVYPYYDQTKFEVVHHWDEGRQEAFQKSAGVPQTFLLDVDSRVSLVADKPVSVAPFDPRQDIGTYVRFLPAQPDFLQPAVLKGQYRGYLVGLEPPGGVDPAFFSGIPGQSVRIPFHVQNFGRWSEGQVLPDSVELTASVTPPELGAVARFAQPRMLLTQSTSAATHLEITLPANLPANAVLTVSVRATSEGNPTMTDSFTAIIHGRQVFDVEAWFGEPTSGSGPKVQGVRLARGETAKIPFAIKNTGSGRDAFSLALGSLGGGWAAEIVDAQERLLTSTDLIDAASTRAYFLRLRTPSTEEVAAVVLTLDVASLTAPTAVDRIVANARLSLGQALELSANSTHESVEPGGSATFFLRASNTGRDAVSVKFSAGGSHPTGWTVKFTGGGNPANGPVSLLPGQELLVPIQVNAPANARALDLVTVLAEMSGNPDGPGMKDAIALSVSVRAIHRILILPVAEVSGRPDATVTVPLKIQNLGNGNETLVWAVASLPGSWNATLPPILRLEPGKPPTDLQFRIRVPAEARPGPVPVTLEALGGDSSRTLLNLSIRVEENHELAWSPVGPAAQQPGDAFTRLVRLENRGNVPEQVRVSAEGPEDWTLTFDAETAAVAPGDSYWWTLRGDVPRDFRPSNVTLTLRAATFDDRASSEAKLDVSVDHFSLVLVNADLIGSAGRGNVRFVVATLANQGSVPAKDVIVKVLSGPSTLDQVRFDSIGPNGTVVASLRWVSEEIAEIPRLVWGTGQGEAFEAFGQDELESPEPKHRTASGFASAPGAVAIALVGLVLAAFQAGQTRRRE